MDIILFNPPRYSNGLHPKFNNALMWLASYLKRRDVDVRVVPLTDEHFAETVKRELTTYSPRFVGIACKWWDTLYSSTHIASLVKKHDPKIVTIAGGHTAGFFSTELVEKTDFDWVIRGDGEEPLYRLVTGGEPINSVTAGATAVASIGGRYIQTEETLKETNLVDDLDGILSDTSVLNSYIWTGKGCVESCVYCAANAFNNVNLFGRAKYIYRPIDEIVREIQILAEYPGSSRVTLDFDPVRSPDAEDYYRELFSKLPDKKYNCYFFSWSLPSKTLVDHLAKTFHFVELCVDVQTPSDRLRKVLGDQRFLKPYFSDEALDDVLGHVFQYDNFTTDLSTLMGLPFETDEDVATIKKFSDYFYDKYEDSRYTYVSPMNVEPGAPLLRQPDKYDMVLFRKTFDDFMTYTRRSFEKNINCYQPSSYGDGVLHPLGVCPKGDYEKGDYFKVYEIWKGVQENIDRRSAEKTISRMKKYRKFGMLKAGIQGGVDQPTLARTVKE
jgi:radical SAM superfamily enzyme YgiQ (UPF0313 family)